MQIGDSIAEYVELSPEKTATAGCFTCALTLVYALGMTGLEGYG